MSNQASNNGLKSKTQQVLQTKLEKATIECVCIAVIVCIAVGVEKMSLAKTKTRFVLRRRGLRESVRQKQILSYRTDEKGCA